MVKLSELVEELKYLNYDYNIESSNKIRIKIGGDINIDIYLGKDSTSIFCGASSAIGDYIHYFLSDYDRNNDIHKVLEIVDKIYLAIVGIIKSVLETVSSIDSERKIKIMNQQINRRM